MVLIFGFYDVMMDWVLKIKYFLFFYFIDAKLRFEEGEKFFYSYNVSEWGVLFFLGYSSRLILK